MGLEGAVRLGMRRELEAIEDPEERERLFSELVAGAYERGRGLNMAAYGEIDDVIDPADSRRWIETLFDERSSDVGRAPGQEAPQRRRLVAPRAGGAPAAASRNPVANANERGYHPLRGGHRSSSGVDLEDHMQDPDRPARRYPPRNWTEADETPIPAARRPAMRTLRTVAELRTALAPARARRPLDRAGADDGSPPRRPPRAARPGTGGVRHGRRHAVRQPLPVRRAGRPRPLPPRRAPRRRPGGAKRGADVLFAPAAEEVYPEGFATTVEVAGVSEPLEGASRGADHFRGVATVVTKLLCMSLPDVAYFGQKDAQQLLVIRRLVADLNLPVRIAAVPTVREADGLALSSRNLLLSADERAPGARDPAGAAPRLASGRWPASAPPTAARSSAPARCSPTTGSRSSTWRSWTRTASPRLTELDGDGLLLVAARVGRCAPDRQRDRGPQGPPVNPPGRGGDRRSLTAASTSVRIGVPHVKPPRHPGPPPTRCGCR